MLYGIKQYGSIGEDNWGGIYSQNKPVQNNKSDPNHECYG
jgi:hypothetical protein